MWPSFTSTRQHLDSPPRSRSIGPLQSNTGRNRRILVVDDDEVTRDTFSRILRSAGYEATTAGSASESIDRAREGADVILLDLRLGDESGLDVLRAMQAERLRGRVVVVTGYADTRSTVAAMKLGAVDYVSKPLFQDDLLRVVEETLNDFFDEIAEDHSRAPEEDVESYAAARWAEAVVKVLAAPDDPKTVAAWGRTIGQARGTIRNVCSMADVSPKCSLDLARVLRAVSKAHDVGRSKPENFLNAPDPRTHARLLLAAGISNIPRPTAGDVLARQCLILDADAIAALRRRLR